MTFCFRVQTTSSGSPSNCYSLYNMDVIAKQIPVTFSDTSCGNGEGFLGNYNAISGSPFYTGIGCPATTPLTTTTVVNGSPQTVGTPSCISPALFQMKNGGNDTITLSNIELIDPQGAVATGYEVLTADAETVDFSNGNSVSNIANGGSYIKWTSLLPTSSALPFEILPNSPTSVVGNACNMVPSADQGATTAGYYVNDGDDPNNPVNINGTSYYGSLVGDGTTTGTVAPPTVNGSAEPVTIQAQLQGEGFNAVAFGLYLP
jgi:hypothetical protein